MERRRLWGILSGLSVSKRVAVKKKGTDSFSRVCCITQGERVSGYKRGDLDFPLPILQVLGLLVWALLADTTYHLHAAYGWVLFVSIFLWVVTVLLFVMYLLQLPMKFYMVPWPLMLMIFNAVATVLYIAAFVTCSAAVRPTSWRQWDYNRRAAASFFAGLVMLTYGASTFFSFRAWKGLGSNAATSQAASHA